MIDKKPKIGLPLKCAEGTFINSLENCGIDVEDLIKNTNVIRNWIKYIKIIYPDYTESNVELKKLKPIIINRIGFERYLINRMSVTKSTSTPNSARWVYLKLNTKLESMNYDKKRKIWKLKFTNPKKVSLEIDSDGNVQKLDHLKHCATESNGKGKCFVPIWSKVQNEVYTKTVIGADGINSIVGKLTGLKQKLKPDEFFKCIQISILLSKKDKLTQKETQTMTMIFSQKVIPNGYGWVFPKTNRQLNIGLGFIANQDIDLEKALGSMLFRFLNLPLEYKIQRKFFANVPMTLPPDNFADLERKVMLVGDAGNFVLSSLGGGIATSLWTGKIAGRFFPECWVFKGRTMKNLLPKLQNAFKLNKKLYNTDPIITEKLLKRIRLLCKLHKLFPGLLEKYGAKNLMYYDFD